MKMYTVEKRINNTTIFCKVPYDCLSLKQKQHMGIKKLRREKSKYLNSVEQEENVCNNQQIDK